MTFYEINLKVQLLGNLQGKASQIPHLYLLSKVKLVKSTQDLFGKNQNQLIYYGNYWKHCYFFKIL